jgi:predicted RND superfamily exporter protein
MSKTFVDEFNYISIITMIAIFIVVALTFKSLIIPIILVGVIQCAVYLTMGILALSGGTVYFIALLIVQSILMGSTIDYAILYTSYYIEERTTKNRKEAIISAYNQSIHTILTSGSILVIVTFIVGMFATAITAKICITLCKGTLCSIILILIFLPAILGAFDKFVVKNKKVS